MKTKAYTRFLALFLIVSLMLGMPTVVLAQDLEESISTVESNTLTEPSVVTEETDKELPSELATISEKTEEASESEQVSEPTESEEPKESEETKEPIESEETEETKKTKETKETEETEDPDLIKKAALLAAQADEDKGVSDYSTFLSNIKQLETYARSYAGIHPEKNVNTLVLNYIRTGIKKYTDDQWAIMAGPEEPDFVEFVAEMDFESETQVAGLRNLSTFTIPNGNTVEFGHMFATMNITWYSWITGSPEATALTRADMGGWAGDITDLMWLTKDAVEDGDIEVMTKEIKDNYLGLEVEGEGSHSFGYEDIYGDLDAFYLVNELRKGGNAKSLSAIMQSYFSVNLSDKQRASYFVNNRFGGVKTKNEIRSSVFDTYKSNELLSLLEGKYGVSTRENLRIASCYAFADYLYELVGEAEQEENKFYSIFSKSESVLAPGVTQEINYALTADEKQIVYYIATADIMRNDVDVFANYRNNDGSSWGMARITDQMAAAQEKHSDPSNSDNYIPNYNAIVGVNADFYNMNTGEPTGVLVMDGVEYHRPNGNFFGVLMDGTPIIGSRSDYDNYKDQMREAVGGSTFLVKNGESVVNATSDYYNQRHSRTCVGITADGQVVLMALDGRQEPFSAGGSAVELAQIMLEAGCVTAINLDGGGSTTFAAKQEGADEVTVVNRPSDGYERSVSSSLMIVSTAHTTDEFDHAILRSDADYMTVGSTVSINAHGVSESGSAADIPEGVEWQISNQEIGTLKDNVFTASSKGSTTVQLVLDGKIIGSKTLNVVSPDSLKFTQTNMNIVYGHEIELPLLATYKGKQVKISSSDIRFTLSNNKAGVMDGFSFTGDEASGVRNVRVNAQLRTDLSISTSIDLAMFKENEAIFDFSTAMMGDSMMSWNRIVSNSSTNDNYNYMIVNPDDPIEAEYTFGVDMQKVAIPEKLNDLIGMVAGGDLENATAWNLLLQFAERVGTQTTVKVEIQLNPNVEVDYSNIRVVNEYFELVDTELDKDTNVLTATIRWVKQTKPIPLEEANPIVIISGLKVKHKDDAVWDENNQLKITNTGKVSYDIYLRASFLYSSALSEEFQQNYGIYPYINPDNSSEKGGHMEAEFINFTDEYVLDKALKQGWNSVDDNTYYFVDNKPLTGIQKLPGYKDEGNTFYYDLGDDGVYKGKISGLFELDEAKYYAIQGLLRDGWRVIQNKEGEDQYYYFEPSSKQAVDGKQTINGYHYVFENNVLIEGDWVQDTNGIRYVWADHMMKDEWFVVDGNTYYAYKNNYIARGISEAINIERTGYYIYVFDENGILQQDYSDFGDYQGETYLFKDGVAVYYPGLCIIDRDYYYFNSKSTMVKDQDYFIFKTNDLLPQAIYQFGSDGKLIDSLNGIVKESEDKWYYYKNGIKYYAGLVEIDGDYYYVNGKCEVIHDQSYYITKTNGLLDADTYKFNKDGKLLLRDGIYKESAEKWYYYTDGVLDYAGLIKIDGHYYYVNSKFEVIHDRSYTIFKHNGLKPVATYTFDSEGKLVELNGIVKESKDKWYYYKNGVKSYPGLFKMDGHYYYVNSKFEVIHDSAYTIFKTNNLKPVGTYTFDSEGKLVELNGIVKESKDKWYYYKDGVKSYPGLIKIDGHYYYVNSKCEVIHGREYDIFKTNNLKPKGVYTFDSEGKMVGQLNGIVKESKDKWYYYKNGVKSYPGLIKIDGHYYYVNSKCEVIHDSEYDIFKTNNLKPKGVYTFDSEGKMVGQLNGIVKESKDKWYYYVNGKLNYAGLIKIKGDYYYVNSKYEVIHNRSYTIFKNNGLKPVGTYTFDSQGKLIK